MRFCLNWVTSKLSHWDNGLPRLKSCQRTLVPVIDAACATLWRGCKPAWGGQQWPHELHLGLNKFDFEALLKASYRKTLPPGGLMSDCKSHFHSLRATVLA